MVIQHNLQAQNTDRGLKAVVSKQDVATGKKNLYNPKQNLFVDTYENTGRTMKLVQNAVNLVSEMRSFWGGTESFGAYGSKP